MFTIRSVRWPADKDQLTALDTSFTTDHIYRVISEDLTFRLAEEAVDPPLHKHYNLVVDEGYELKLQTMDYLLVAEQDGRIVGMVAADYAYWNRRLVLWHLYVAPEARKHGLATTLLESVIGYARGVKARCVWLETQNTNVPAIRFYQQRGFRFCGLDMRLYDPSGAAAGETALFFALDLD